MEYDRDAFLALVASGRILFPQCDGGPFHQCGRWCRTAEAKDPSDKEAADAATARNADAGKAWVQRSSANNTDLHRDSR